MSPPSPDEVSVAQDRPLVIISGFEPCALPPAQPPPAPDHYHTSRSQAGPPEVGGQLSAALPPCAHPCVDRAAGSHPASPASSEGAACRPTPPVASVRPSANGPLRPPMGIHSGGCRPSFGVTLGDHGLCAKQAPSPIASAAPSHSPASGSQWLPCELDLKGKPSAQVLVDLKRASSPCNWQNPASVGCGLMTWASPLTTGVPCGPLVTLGQLAVPEGF